jgi:hypothetical protein
VQRPLAWAWLAAALGLGLTAALEARGQDFTLPKKYQSLYQDLDRQLAAFMRSLPPAPAGRELRRAAPLALPCEAAVDLQRGRRWEAALQELDALRRVGTQVVVLEVCYPMLTPAFQDPRPLLEAFANLANQVRLREMALMVEHRVLPLTSASIQATRYYHGMKRTRFFSERLEEARSLVLALQPDYLTLIADPAAPAAGLRLTASQWRTHIASVTSRLQSDLGDLVPPLGAGSGVWGERPFIEAFAAVPGLAYIDLRFYPLEVSGRKLLDRVLEWPDRVRAIDPSKRVVLSQAWLSKAHANEPFRGSPDPTVVAREAFGFWAPLDAKFLRAMAQAARTREIELLGVSRPRHLFAYLDFFDPATFRLSARLLDELADQRAAAGMQQGRLTEPGRVFGAL